MADGSWRPSGPDLDLRLVRYFTVVAEHLHFGRAATALRVAQPSLSRQIQRLEDSLGARLLERTNQGTRLTAAGEAFLPRAQGLLHAADQAVHAARLATAAHTVTVGHVEDLNIAAAVRELRRRRPEAHVRTRRLDRSQERALLERRVDALVCRTPLAVPTDDLDLTVLYDEPRVLVLPAFHRLAGKESVTPEDFADEPMVACSGASWEWTAFWRLEPRADRSAAPVAPLVADTVEEKLDAVADGLAVALVAADDPRLGARDDVVAVAVDGIEPCRVVVATRRGDTDPLVAQFRAAALRTFTREEERPR
ncbi:LysR family transcriptional regulator [Virgisporangium aliadipatigenens]|uniref:LysR family transcriptional regulator n=1 Tax=Virgisporangium aliadipatigenens TaxID=741659 RepID=A0A8J4DN50_9ACTN|nr:LysR substrate-binding domain-containing protein [Virgisporangium aliadipatigenens]GIJ44034.1 LysR family transcriptional regulator [Virgisporangium aliadipatigenens]